MNLTRAKEILRNIVEFVAMANDTEDQIKELLKYGFTGDELVNEFNYSKADVEDVTGEVIGGKIAVTVYRTAIDPDYDGDDNLTVLEVDRAALFKYFVNIVDPDGADDATSDEDRFTEWLNTYTADSTTGLYDFIKAEEKKADESPVKNKEYYQKLYDEKYDKLLEHWKLELDGMPNVSVEEAANEDFNENATAEEVVGYYIAWHGDDAFKDWVENSQFYEKERGKMPSMQDREVTRILGELYDNTVVKNIEWYIPEGTSVNPKLSEVKVIPKVEGSSDKAITEAVRTYLQLTYATEPKAFSFMLPDGRMAGYRNWALSSTSKKDEGVGCYGAGSEPCLNGCPGCDNKDEGKAVLGNGFSKYINFDVKICLDADFLLKRAIKKDGYDLAQDVKDTVMQTEYYCEQIHKEMEERNILSEYIDLFDCADTNVIIDKYCNIDTESITFDFNESACSIYDRNQCWFKVPVSFDLEKYIKVMDQGIDKVREQAEASHSMEMHLAYSESQEDEDDERS